MTEYISKDRLIEAREAVDKALAVLNGGEWDSSLDLDRIDNLLIHASDLLTPDDKEDD